MQGTTPTPCRSKALDPAEASARAMMWTALTSLAGTIKAGRSLHLESTVRTSSKAFKKQALAEDHELRGFLPLAPAHAGLVFARGEETPGSAAQEEAHLRLERMDELLRALGTIVDREGKALQAAQPSAQLFAGFVRVMPAWDMCCSSTLAQTWLLFDVR